MPCRDEVRSFSGYISDSKVLKGMTGEGYLRKITYWFPYSAGQLIETNGGLIDRGSIWVDKNRDPADRRRVGIRLFRFEDR